MKDPLISIIIPVYNVENNLAQCLESIRKQTYSSLQIIVVDDGSTDQSGSICDQYAAKDSRIEVIHQPNRGVVAARRCGLEHAKGTYIGFVDGDDTIASDMYAVLCEAMQSHEVDCVCAGYWEGKTRKVSPKQGIVDLVKYRNEFLEAILFPAQSHIPSSIWSKLFRAELIQKSFAQIPMDCCLGEDLLVFCICALEGNKIVLLDSTHYYYNIHKGSLSNKNEIDDTRKVFYLYEQLCKLFQTYGYDKNLKTVMDEFLWSNLLGYMSRISTHEFQIARYCFPSLHRVLGKKIIIYGAGMIGRDYYAQISRYTDCKVVAWIDSHPENYHYSHINVSGIEVLEILSFDLIIIAIKDEETATIIREQLLEKQIEQTKIVWEKPQKLSLEVLNSYKG